jgi:uncharacterized membrane protein YoaK (UPF0700 family)
MLRHTGTHRTYKHNLRLAALLCLTAGFVNVAGFLAFNVLTTNVTGHVALFAEKLIQGDYTTARIVGLWMLMFLLGAFMSSMLIGYMGRERQFSYTLPIIIEMILLVFVGSFAYVYDNSVLKMEFFAGSLLFAMGMQNAMVSMISGSVVRTTHLTGMFTDLGIELSSIIRAKDPEKKQLQTKIALRLVIIGCFFIGGIAGGYLYGKIKYHTFYIPALILIVAMVYDIFRLKTIKLVHKLRYSEKD